MNDRFWFRVWSYKQKRMINSWDYSSKRDFLYGALIDHRFFGNGLFITMQSTGMKDKNEKLIYEGDIVKYTSKKSKTNPEKEPYTENYKVVWQEKYTGYNLQSKEKVNCFNLGIMTDDIEVVGNIYENEELLDDGRS